jgi:methionine-rich copper-binding protein CopC
MRCFALRLAAMIAIDIMPGMALSHALLSEAVPLVGGTVPASPKEIRLTFTEALEPGFSGIDLTAAGGRPIATGPAVVDARNDKQLVLALPQLAAGTYRVHWHVVSIDTHRTEGEYSFVVKP